MLHTRGRFAEMNGVSLFTLRHYEKLGLLQPAAVNDKGYRFYSEREIRRLSMITLLTRLGLSLREVKDLIDRDGDISADEFDELLLSLQQKARQEVRRYQAIESLIDNLVDYAISFDVRLPGESSFVGPTTPRGFVSDPVDFCDPDCDAVAQVFLLETERALGHSAEYPLSYLVDLHEDGGGVGGDALADAGGGAPVGEAAPASGIAPGGEAAPAGKAGPTSEAAATPQLVSRVFVRTNKPYDDAAFHTWTAEETLTFVHEGPRATAPQALRSLHAQALSAGYEIAGPAILTEMQRHFFSTDETDRHILMGLLLRRRR